MTLQSSGPIYLSQIQGEFGGSNPIYLSEYYGRASGIPGSGSIWMSQFYGKSASTTLVSPENPYFDGSNGDSGITAYEFSPNTFGGYTVAAAYFSDTFGLFGLQVFGNAPQALFNSIQPEGGPVFQSSAAIFYHLGSGPDYAVWEWPATRPGNWDGTGNTSIILT